MPCKLLITTNIPTPLNLNICLVKRCDRQVAWTAIRPILQCAITTLRGYHHGAVAASVRAGLHAVNCSHLAVQHL